MNSVKGNNKRAGFMSSLFFLPPRNWQEQSVIGNGQISKILGMLLPDRVQSQIVIILSAKQRCPIFPQLSLGNNSLILIFRL